MSAPLREHSFHTQEYAALMAEKHYHFLTGDGDRKRILTGELSIRKYYKLCIAGLLHDYAKIYSDEQLTSIALEQKIRLSPFEIECKPILHGFVAPYLIKRDFGISDKEIDYCIMSHTIGSQNMSAIDRILYISDKLEGTRNYSGIDDLRKISLENLDLCLLEVYKSNIIYVIMRNRTLHPDTSKIWNNICGGLKNAI